MAMKKSFAHYKMVSNKFSFQIAWTDLYYSTEDFSNSYMDMNTACASASNIKSLKIDATYEIKII